MQNEKKMVSLIGILLLVYRSLVVSFVYIGNVVLLIGILPLNLFSLIYIYNYFFCNFKLTSLFFFLTNQPLVSVNSLLILLKITVFFLSLF